jgi:hypothetical protein
MRRTRTYTSILERSKMANSATTFGFEITNLTSGYGADLQVEWTGGAKTLQYLDLDVSCATTSPPSATGYGELNTAVLLTVGTPSYAGNSAGVTLPGDANFGGATVGSNPGGKSTGQSGPHLTGLTVITMKFPLASGVTATDSRHVTVPCDVAIATGNYLVFHFDMASTVAITLDAEMQLCIGHS